MMSGKKQKMLNKYDLFHSIATAVYKLIFLFTIFSPYVATVFFEINQFHNLYELFVLIFISKYF